MSDPRKPDPFAAPIQLANMDLDPVRHVAKSTVSAVELLATTARTGAAHGFCPALHLLQTQIQDLNDKLGEVGVGDAPRAVVLDIERENASIGLRFIHSAVRSIRDKLAAGGLVTDLESLEDQASLLKRGLQLLGESPEAEPVAESATKWVRLFGPQDGPIVKGHKKETLTTAQYDVVRTLLSRGDKGLTKDALDSESRHGDSRKILKRLAASDPDWASVISFPVTSGNGYRIL